MNTSDKLRMHELILKSLENEISGEEFAELNRYLEAGPAYRAYYQQLIDMYVELYEGSEIITASMEDIDPILQKQLWESLAEYEKRAPAQAVEAAAVPEIIKVDRSVRRSSQRRLNRTSLYTAIGALAAIVFLIVYINFIPARKVAEPVATMTDAIGARWANTAAVMQKGTEVSSDQGAVILTKGIAEFLCQDQTRIVFEAPAEFEFISANQVALNYGRLYAISPEGAVGFTVDTPGTRIVDLGTEFGVKVEVTGATEVHMIKGKANLIIGDPQSPKRKVVLTEKQARRVDADQGIFKILPFQNNDFVREIDSEQNTVWRGQPINLADIVGGGDGFGAGVPGAAIDPRTAESFLIADVTEWIPHEGTNEYQPVSWHDFIDGVFVPDGENGPVTISTDGRKFAACPDTDNRFWAGIANGGRYPEPLDMPPKNLLFNNADYGNAEHPCIFMHSSLGITFDLEAIRKAYPDVAITEFRAACGICDDGPNRLPFADFWVLVDGRIAFSRTGVKTNSVHQILLPITERDRFLTLVTTDGGKEVSLLLEDGTPVPIDSDWCLFADPYLIAERK
jgi:hypothetical protein